MIWWGSSSGFVGSVKQTTALADKFTYSAENTDPVFSAKREAVILSAETAATLTGRLKPPGVIMLSTVGLSVPEY